MHFVVPVQPQPCVPVAGSQDMFPVHRIYCVGRNYAAHAREMGSDPDREPPFFFCKPADAVFPVSTGEIRDLPYAANTTNLHHEVELVVAIGLGGRDIPVANAAKCIWGYAVGLDMTRRDLQSGLKSRGQPWELGKAFDHSAPVTPLTPVAQTGPLTSGRIWLQVNDETKQTGDLRDMIWSISETIAELSRYFELHAGDLIFTGTPEGVGPVKPGDVVEFGVDGLQSGTVRIAAATA